MRETVSKITRDGSNRYGGGNASNLWRLEFDNLSELVDYCQSPLRAGSQGTSRDIGRGGFHHAASWEEAYKAATIAWPEGEERAKKYSNALFTRVAAMMERPYFVYDQEGADFDVARALSGEPECWMDPRPKEEEGTGRIIKLVYNACCSGGIGSDVLLTRGCAVAALVMLLEFSGRSVELEVRMDDSSGGWWAEHTCIVKRAGQPLNINEVVFALGHPDMFRRMYFSTLEHGTAEQRRAFGAGGGFGSGYGMVVETPQEQRGDIYVGSMLYGGAEWTSQASAERWLMERLKEQGVEMAESSEPASEEYVPPPTKFSYAPPPRRSSRYSRRRRW